ncbi:MAG: histidine phosphatase family protein [Chloroflexi bacterium]|nr:histidine phosphatase family protein [Chloroflexota bacterium]
MLTLVLTRHGATDRSDPEQYLGQRIEAHLTEEGRAAARALGERLVSVTFERVIASPLERALETARLIRPDDRVATDPHLAEADYGLWEGRTVAEIEARWPAEREAYEADPGANAATGGESGEAVARRVGLLLDELAYWSETVWESAEPEHDHRVLLVGHSTLNRVLLAVALGVPLRDYRRRFRQDWANLTVLRFDRRFGGGWQLLLCNDMAHLRGTSGVTWD